MTDGRRTPHWCALVVAVAALVLVAGCAGLADVDTTGTDGRAATPADGRAATPADESLTTGPLSPGPLSPGPLDADLGETYTVTVVDVVDGDTLDVRYPDGSTDTVRLLGVDTPEVHAENEPAEFEGVPATDAGRACLRAAGKNASAFLTQRLTGATVRVVVDPTADRRDRYGRLLAYVVHDNRTLNYRLLAQGHARVYETTFRYAEAFSAAERRAQAAGRGLWRCRTPTDSATATTGDTERVGSAALSVVTVHADAAGNDHENLNGEYVVLRNERGDALAIGGWAVTDATGHVYTFPAGVTVGAGATVTLYSGVGTDGDGRYYWDRERAVWNNGGDTVVVSDDGGTVVAQLTY